MRILVGLLITSWMTTAMAAEPFLNLFGGMAQHHQETMDDSSTVPQGTAYGAGFGHRMNFYEFEIAVSKGMYSADIEHDNVANTIEHDQLQITLALNFYLLRNIYLRLGYAMTKFEQKTKTPVSGASGEGLEQEYGLKKDTATGLVLGGGYALIQTTRFQLYGQFEHHMITDISASQNLVTVGMRFYYP